jgi:hypothetical protein
MIKKTLVLGGVSLLVFAGCGGASVDDVPVDDVFDIEVELPEGDIDFPEKMTEDDLTDMMDAYNDLFEEADGEASLSGSCNSIAAHSVCVDYRGSYWKTEDFKKLNCSGSDMVYSKNTCPYSEIGGCQNGEGTMFETVVWMYQHGGDPITNDALPHAIGACNAVYGAQWVLPEF